MSQTGNGLKSIDFAPPPKQGQNRTRNRRLVPKQEKSQTKNKPRATAFTPQIRGKSYGKMSQSYTKTNTGDKPDKKCIQGHRLWAQKEEKLDQK